MAPCTVEDVLPRLERDDPLGLGAVRWAHRRLEDRRYSSIHLLVPVGAEALLRERTGGLALVLKLYRAVQAERRQREFDDHARVYRALGPDAGVVRPVACYPDMGAVITLQASGAPFGRLVREACRWGDRAKLARSAALCTRAGAWLRAFQSHGAIEMAGQRPEHLSSREGYLAYVDERLRILRGQRFGIEPALHVRLLAHAAAALHAVPDAFQTVTWAHSDFGPHNLLADGERLYVLDFELRAQHPYFDAAYFVEALAHAAGPLAEPSRQRRLEHAFLAGYGGNVDRSLLALFRLRHVACASVSEARRGGMASWRTWPGLFALRERLRRLPDELADRAGSHAA